MIHVATLPDYPHSQAFIPFAESLRDAMKELGAEKNIMLAAHILRGYDIPDDWIIYNAEQIGVGFGADPVYLELLKNHEVWDYSETNVESLKRLGIEAKHCPVGYMPCLTRIEPVEEDIDVLFYGSVNERRSKILRQLGGKVHVAPIGTYGKELDALIARSKVVLNIHFYPTAIHEIFRTSYLFANKKCVVSEVGYGDIATGGFCEYDRLLEYCESFLRNDVLRDSVAQNGYHLFSKMELVDSVRRCL